MKATLGSHWLESRFILALTIGLTALPSFRCPGRNWTQTTGLITNWSCVAASSGVSPTIILTSSGCSTVSVSGDGSRLAALDFDHNLVTSADSATSMIDANAPKLYWTAIALSWDGNQMVATSSDGGIYVARAIARPALKIAATNENLLISWWDPSRTFFLEGSDQASRTGWITVNNAPILNPANLRNEMTLPRASSNCFYRLRR